MTTQPDVDLERLFRLRLVVARMGELDRAGWWNTRGQLGPMGAAAVSRGLPRTHAFGRARSVFAVAAFRCDEVFNPPSSWTLWRLPSEIEERFDARWEHWVDAAEDWTPTFDAIAALDGTDVTAALRALGLVEPADETMAAALRTSSEGRAVPLPSPFGGSDAEIAQLALGFSLGRPGAPAVPYARAVD